MKMIVFHLYNYGGVKSSFRVQAALTFVLKAGLKIALFSMLNAGI